MQPTWEQEQASGERFEFGSNWQSFLNTLDEERIEQARQSLRDMLGMERMDGLRLLRGMSPLPCKYWREHRKFRGMSKWHDYVDWVGGYPFEVAKPHEIFDFVRTRGFTLSRMVTPGPRHFCNEFVFRREDA